MLGNVMVNTDELKGRDAKLYRNFYCGVCTDLRKACGQAAGLTLSYDCVFLAILLTALYEEPVSEKTGPCILHPFDRKKIKLTNRYTAYAADMCVLLSYHNLMDDWLDEKKKRSLAEALLLKKAYKKTAVKYPRQVKAIRKYLRELHLAEAAKTKDMDKAGTLTGRLFEEIYEYASDVWSPDIRQIGFFIGKFIYMLDAYEDLDRDREKGNYNPFLFLADKDDYEERVKSYLYVCASGAARAFERLPIVQYTDILRNVMYSGIWVKYQELQDKRGK